MKDYEHIRDIDGTWYVEWWDDLEDRMCRVIAGNTKTLEMAFQRGREDERRTIGDTANE